MAPPNQGNGILLYARQGENWESWVKNKRSKGRFS